ncbi:hypothetical protein CDL15_Pgr000933 [Punica granatum]|uniref:Uncharacterized protein n=1 Tax=Punica granatum TaxID=22663 RepID=A0A218XHT4_PUNGR|nr:hypothetical protein CDL15_Pgr000933 [Punica granatum]
MSALNVLGHDGDPLGVDVAEAGILEEPHLVCLRCLLERRLCAARNSAPP